MRRVVSSAVVGAALLSVIACRAPADPAAPTIVESSTTAFGDPDRVTTTTTSSLPGLFPPDTAADSTPPDAVGVDAMIGSLVVAPERDRSHYERTSFEHWVDADADGCDTRCEVLAEERLSSLPGLAGGGWLSLYDGYSTDDPSELDIDHLVPLAEAYASGAHAWDTERRKAFANDTGIPASLIAVTASTNRSKGDRDPHLWQPPRTEHWCAYVRDWVTVKLRWGLTADTDEVNALRNMSAGCRLTGSPVDTSPVAPSVAPPMTTGEYYRSCSEVRAANRDPLHRGQSGYRPGLDRDNDGVACE